MTSPDVNIIFEEEPVEITLNEDPVEIKMPAGQNGQSLRPRGAWSSSESYGYLDLVSYQGSSYVATKTVPTGTLPTDTGFWMLSAEKGLDGASEWGDITGDIANQTDLAQALAGKANVGDSYTKAETDALLVDKADADDVYTKDETDALLQDKAPVILNSASGSIASFSDGSPAPVTALTVGIEPVQSGTGDPSPTNVRPISGWTKTDIHKLGKNLIEFTPQEKTFYGVTCTINSDGSIKLNGTNKSSATVVCFNLCYTGANNGRQSDNIKHLPAGTYKLVTGSLNGTVKMQVMGSNYYNAGSSNSDLIAAGNDPTFTIDEKYAYTWVRIIVNGSAVFNNDIFYPWIYRIDDVSEDYTPVVQEQVNIVFPDTVYGGTLNVLTGVLTVTDVNIASYNGETIPSTWISDRDVYAPGTTPTTGAQVVYKLASPQTIPLTPSQLSTLLGQNNIWADTGDTSVTYRADTKLFIQEQIAESETLTRKMIADIANGDISPKSLATGDLIIVGDELRKATVNIGNGSAITASNSTTATLADVIKALQ